MLITLLAGLSLLASAEASRHRRAADPATSSVVASRESVLEYFLLEELYPRAFVGNIVTEYGLDRRYPPSVVQQLRFRFLTTSAGTRQPNSAFYPSRLGNSRTDLPGWV